VKWSGSQEASRNAACTRQEKAAKTPPGVTDYFCSLHPANNPQTTQKPLGVLFPSLDADMKRFLKFEFPRPKFAGNQIAYAAGGLPTASARKRLRAARNRFLAAYWIWEIIEFPLTSFPER